MTNPYLITGPALISFSGGRTSAYLLKHIIDAHGGTLPDNVHVGFCNTGKERQETLDFVQECGERWAARIVWLEYDPEAEHKTAIVSHNSASRNGEPFAAVIRARSMLPNPTMRFCTIEMKIRRIAAYAKHFLGFKTWTSVVGLRADEMHRVQKQIARAASGKDGKGLGIPCMPLADAGVTKRDIQAWWAGQPFDLRLPNVNGTTPAGNCDLCFLKGEALIRGLLRGNPELATWWINQEINAPGKGKLRKAEMALFRADRPSYAAMLDASQRQGDLIDFLEGDSIDCACTD